VILIIDNYDSFVHNLARYVRLEGRETRVVRNDRIDAAGVRRLSPSHIVISPGPCSPAEAGASCSIVTALAGTVPILGVCLGHQCIGAAYGAGIGRAARPVHGAASEIVHTGTGIFAGLPSPMRVGRYHSLQIGIDDVPHELEVVATTHEGEVMAVRHREHEVWGVQFHPESVLTEHGHRLIASFLALGGRV
jgi:para-aminobenzoate synthetase component II